MLGLGGVPKSQNQEYRDGLAKDLKEVRNLGESGRDAAKDILNSAKGDEKYLVAKADSVAERDKDLKNKQQIEALKAKYGVAEDQSSKPVNAESVKPLNETGNDKPKDVEGEKLSFIDEIYEESGYYNSGTVHGGEEFLERRAKWAAPKTAFAQSAGAGAFAAFAATMGSLVGPSSIAGLLANGAGAAMIASVGMFTVAVPVIDALGGAYLAYKKFKEGRSESKKVSVWKEYKNKFGVEDKGYGYY